MNKKIIYLEFNLIYVIVFFLISLSFIHTYNTSTIYGFELVFLLLLIPILFGIFLGKLLFNYSYSNKKFKKLNIENFEKTNILKNIKSSLILLFIIYSIFYLGIYFYSDTIFGNLPFSLGIINSCKYISKIYFISLPLYSFEIAFFEYCSFIKSYKNPIILKIFKLIALSISGSLLLNYFGFNGFLYSKILTDLLFFIYYIYQLKRILLLCKIGY